MRPRRRCALAGTVLLTTVALLGCTTTKRTGAGAPSRAAPLTPGVPATSTVTPSTATSAAPPGRRSGAAQCPPPAVTMALEGGGAVGAWEADGLPSLPPADASEEAPLFEALMVGPHSATPDGVPTTWDWAHHPDVSVPTNGAMAAMTAWGQIYAEAGVPEPPPGTVRVEVSHIRSFIWSNSERRWALVQDSLSADGAHYFDDFRGNRSVPADLKTEPDGGTSVAMIPGFNFHFWPLTGRAGVTPGDVGAVITTYEARLIGPDAAQARYLANAGGDWWRTMSAAYSGASTVANNAGIGEGRFVPLCSSWSTIAFYTGGP